MLSFDDDLWKKKIVLEEEAPFIPANLDLDCDF